MSLGGIEQQRIGQLLSNIQQIISSDQTLNRINNTLKGEIIDMNGLVVAKGKPLVNEEGHATIMNTVGILVNESVKLGILDDQDISNNTMAFGEGLAFLIGVHASEMGIESKNIFNLVVAIESLVHAHFTSARDGTTLKNLTQQISIIDQKVSRLENEKVI